ncbi:MAG: hypothetical protein K0R98_1198 [Rickettsiaceae bacterium]|nr:hypothetical protein [Rickettsiaceae bacterium]
MNNNSNVKLKLLVGTAVVLFSYSAEAGSLRDAPALPSVEVNFGAIEKLKADEKQRKIDEANAAKEAAAAKKRAEKEALEAKKKAEKEAKLAAKGAKKKEKTKVTSSSSAEKPVTKKTPSKKKPTQKAKAKKSTKKDKKIAQAKPIEAPVKKIKQEPKWIEPVKPVEELKIVEEAPKAKTETKAEPTKIIEKFDSVKMAEPKEASKEPAIKIGEKLEPAKPEAIKIEPKEVAKIEAPKVEPKKPEVGVKEVIDLNPAKDKKSALSTKSEAPDLQPVGVVAEKTPAVESKDKSAPSFMDKVYAFFAGNKKEQVEPEILPSSDREIVSAPTPKEPQKPIETAQKALPPKNEYLVPVDEPIIEEIEVVEKVPVMSEETKPFQKNVPQSDKDLEKLINEQPVILPNKIENPIAALPAKPEDKPVDLDKLAVANKPAEVKNGELAKEPEIPPLADMIELKQKDEKAIPPNKNVSEEEWKRVLDDAKKKAENPVPAPVEAKVAPAPAEAPKDSPLAVSSAPVPPIKKPEEKKSVVSSVMEWMPAFNKNDAKPEATSDVKLDEVPVKEEKTNPVSSPDNKPVAASEPDVVKPAEKLPEPKLAALPDVDKVLSPDNLKSDKQISLNLNFKASDLNVAASDEGKIRDFVKQVTPTTKKVKVVSYAYAYDGDLNAARRVSLKRAIAIRTKMIEAGLDSTRISVQALGSQEGSSKNAVEIMTVDSVI